MKNLKITWLSDSTECDQAGCSGGYAEGFVAELDGEIIAEFEPSAHCYGGESCDQDEAYRLIFKALGYNLVTDYEENVD